MRQQAPDGFSRWTGDCLSQRSRAGQRATTNPLRLAGQHFPRKTR